MRSRLLLIILALLPATMHGRAFTPARTTQIYNFEGIIGLELCSASLARYEHSKASDQALVLTNGHCFLQKSTMRFYYRHQTSPIRMNLFAADGHIAGVLKADWVEYSTATNTDITIYKLHETYGEIEAKYGVRALTISAQHPIEHQPIEIKSGFWRRGWTCQIDTFIQELRETPWIWRDSIRYTSACNTVPGTSGSPIVAAGTRTLIGINNTSNRLGRICTNDNPCEFDSATGKVRYSRGQSYGQQTDLIYTCIDQNRNLDLSIPGCRLPH